MNAGRGDGDLRRGLTGEIEQEGRITARQRLTIGRGWYAACRNSYFRGFPFFRRVRAPALRSCRRPPEYACRPPCQGPFDQHLEAVRIHFLQLDPNEAVRRGA